MEKMVEQLEEEIDDIYDKIVKSNTPTSHLDNPNSTANKVGKYSYENCKFQSPRQSKNRKHKLRAHKGVKCVL